MKRKIFITQRRIIDKYGSPCDQLESAYLNLFPKTNIVIIPVPNVGRGAVQKYLADEPEIAGVILSGGNNISPLLNETMGSSDDDCSEIRDETESAILSFARDNKVPVLGICRGMQFINVFFGGSILRDVGDVRGEVHHSGNVHDLMVTETVAEKCLGTDRWSMKSFHRQGINEVVLAKPLRKFIVSGSGIIEGLYHPNLPIAGIQFHPEREEKPSRLVELLVESFAHGRHYWSGN